MFRVQLLVGGVLLAASPVAFAAQRVTDSFTGTSFIIDNATGTAVTVPFDGAAPASGVGFTGTFTAISGDFSGGLYPWSLDVAINVTAPDSQSVPWGVGSSFIGGEQSFGDWPYADFTGGFTNAPASGNYTFTFLNDVNSPGVIGINNPTFHLLTETPDVITNETSDVSSGPSWNRPFSSAGISGLGPVIYEVLPFRPEVSGGYTFESTVADLDGGNNLDGYTFIYKDSFDPNDPLTNLLDLGLGNGFADNGTPRGQSYIEALLFEDSNYYFVTSQWSASSGPQSYQTTITGPGALLAIPEPGVGLLLGLGLFLRRRPRPCPSKASGLPARLQATS